MPQDARVFRLHTVQRLPVSLEEAWAFFSDPRNLARLTPPWLHFEITSPTPERIYSGAIITYRIRPLWRVPVTWLTEITHVDPPVLFVDEQRLGPYRFWHHQHRFRAVGTGVEIEDLVHYALPFGLIGRIAGRLAVAPRLEEIFTYRRGVLDALFNAPAEVAALMASV